MPEIIKTKTSTYEIMQVGIDFLTFNEDYRRIREGYQYKGFQCFSCNRKFEDGEKISLAMIKNHKNRMVCRSCGEKFNKELEEKNNG